MEEPLKLFMVLLGSKPANRTVEQHDYFFGIAGSLQELVPQMIAFWPEAGSSLHIDGWREVTHVEDHSVSVIPKANSQEVGSGKRLFFVNLGGYQSGKLEEQHYTLLTVQDDRKGAIKTSTMTSFFKESSIASVKSASAHIDEKYGIDVDDVYRIDDVLSDEIKSRYDILLSESSTGYTDQIHLGYFKLDKL
jgi:hypothetical protein